ncbi:hypothetical protein QSE00_17255 [Arenibacter sp. M-2]|uniref:hypothetical protein n=1 Tax=Arenibacter sp. M-2 TaxID=3053612 RepID=UPI00257008AE|nr:hypothetical protein [Arenibacter sp. M-2]MDL5513573.1 hypothetical protein [Arenibacter sp. M-2]
MKKIILINTIVLLSLISCTKDGNQNYLDDSNNALQQEETSITYLFGSEEIIVNYTIENDSLVVIPSESSKKIESIYEDFPELIPYINSNDRITLFKNENDLSNFIDKSKSKINSNLSQKNPTLSTSLLIYIDKNYIKPIEWAKIFYGGDYSKPNFPNGTNEERLKELGDNLLWQYLCYSPYVCNYQQPINANDRISSLKVSGAIFRFYEDRDYKGKSFLVDASTEPQSISSLSTLRLNWRHSWNDKISSIKAY